MTRLLLFAASLLSIVWSLTEFRTWSELSICEKAINISYPFAYSKYQSQTIESKGRTNSNLQDFRHECQGKGGTSKCHMCERIACSSDIGTCELQLQGVSTADMSVNMPTVSDIAWAVGGAHRSDYGGAATTHLCVFTSGGTCQLPLTTDFSSCATRCFGHGSLGPPKYKATAPILVEPDVPPIVDYGLSDLWVYPRNCSDLLASGGVCTYSSSAPYNVPVPSFNPQGFTFTMAGSGIAGFIDGDGSAAAFFGPEDVAVDGLGYVFVADTQNNAIRVISPHGRVTTIAGGGPSLSGFRDGNCSYALFSQPKGLDVVRVGAHIITIVIADTGNHRIRRIDIDNSSSLCQVTCVSGLCYNPYTATNPFYNQITPLSGYADGAPDVARFSSPQDVAFLTLQGELLVVVADTSNFLLRLVNLTSGNASTLAGSIEVDTSGVPIEGCLSPCLVGVAGKRDGNLTHAQFYTPQSVSVGANNTIFVADEHRIRVVELPLIVTEYYGVLSQGRVSTLAGTVQGIEDGRGEEATFYNPSGVFVTADNIAYVSDAASCKIRRITPVRHVAQSIACSTRLVDVIRPSGCTSYEQTIDKTMRKVSRVEANIVFNYGHPYAGDRDRGKYIKNCVGSPPASTLDKHFLGVTGDNLVVDDYRETVNEDSEIGTAIVVECPPACSADATIVEGADVYSDVSSLCRSALHAGAVSDSGGVVLVTVDRVNSSYAQTVAGSARLGVTSTSLSAAEQRVFSVEFYKDSINFVHTVAGRPAAKLEGGCGLSDGQPSTLSRFRNPIGLSAAKNTSLTSSNFLFVADSLNHLIRGLAASCTQICENGGSCSGPDTCACLPGWSGVDCTTPRCSLPCSANNVCVAPDTCSCKPGFSGASCATPLCVQTCHNGGVCAAPDTCTCTPGWFDGNCTTPVCSQTCGNGGNCTAPSTCSCPSDWTGLDCRTPVCSPSCSNGGLCVAPNSCHCPPQWSGRTCDNPVCMQGYFAPNEPVLTPHLFSSNVLRRFMYKPCLLKTWCEATNEFECDQLDLTNEEAQVPAGSMFRAQTGRKTAPTSCMEIELPLSYKIPFSLLKPDNSSTPSMRYSAFTPYESNSLNPWRGYEYNASYNGRTGPWLYAADRQMALVQFVSVTEGVYVCANNGNCTAPDICECASGWIGFDCRTPVCPQGFYQPEQENYVSGQETFRELDDFSSFLTNPSKLRWPYSNPSFGIEYESYSDVSTVIRLIQSRGNSSYLGPSALVNGVRSTTKQGGYRCSIRAVTKWENLQYIFEHPNYFSRYMDMSIQFDGNTYTYWNNMFWPPVHSKSKILDQVVFGITFAYTDEGFRRLGIWSRATGTKWEYGTCLMEFRRTCEDGSKSLDLLSGFSFVTVQDTDVSFRPRVKYSDFNVTSRGRWKSEGGECVDYVMRGCYNNGTCIAPNTCVCATGWSGSDCSIPLCKQVCRHNGNCTLPDTCTCEKGWSGFDCSVALCAQECQNGGVCVAPDTCQCEQWENEFRDGRLGGGRPLFRNSKGDPQSTGWTGLDCSVPICVQSQGFVRNVESSSSPGYEVFGGHGGDHLLTCNNSLGQPLPRCPRFDKKVTSNDGRSFYTGCGYDPVDTGCCVTANGINIDCYKCADSLIASDDHTFSCNGPLTVLSGFTSQLDKFLRFLDANGNFKICGKYHLPRNFVDSIGLTDYGTAAYYTSTDYADAKYSSRNFRSNLTSDRFLCNREYWTQGDYLDDAGLGGIVGAGTHFGLAGGRAYRSNDPNYVLSSADITGSLYVEGPQVYGEGLFECFNHGSCLGPDFCSCSDGWDGFNCATPLCRHLQPSGFISGCLNGGICGNKDDCTCIQTSSLLWEVYPDAVKGLTGWTGSDCSIPMCSQGFFDPFCTDLMQAPAGEGCFRCANGGNCTAPDLCTCAEGWTGFDCLTPVCEVIADPLTRTQLHTMYEDKIVSFESDPCGVEAIYGRVLWNGFAYAQGNCTRPNQCACLCMMPYDRSLCKYSATDLQSSYDHCRGPWQDEMISARDVLYSRGPEYIFGTGACEKGFEGNVDELNRFTTCHQTIYSPTYLERNSINITVGTVLGFVFGSLIYYFIKRRWRRQLLLAKIERRKQQRGDDEEAGEDDSLLDGSGKNSKV